MLPGAPDCVVDLDILYCQMNNIYEQIGAKWPWAFTPQLSPAARELTVPDESALARSSAASDPPPLERSSVASPPPQSSSAIKPRISKRIQVKRSPYVGGSGAGLASSKQPLPPPRKPGWFYEQVPALPVKRCGAVIGASNDGEDFQDGNMLKEQFVFRFPADSQTLVEPVFTQDLTFTGFDWLSAGHQNPFTISLEFPNFIDPDNPIKKFIACEMVVFDTQTVPNLYLQVAKITGVFPWSFRLMVSTKTLQHYGLIIESEFKRSDGSKLGPVPNVTKNCVRIETFACFKTPKSPFFSYTKKTLE